MTAGDGMLGRAGVPPMTWIDLVDGIVNLDGRTIRDTRARERGGHGAAFSAAEGLEEG